MGGIARSVFRDFRMARVSFPLLDFHSAGYMLEVTESVVELTITLTVSIQGERPCWQPAGCEEG